MKKSLAILIPVYKQSLNLLEQFSIDYLLTKVTNRTIYFIAPKNLNRSYYVGRYKDIRFKCFEDDYFNSIAGYNKLLLDINFYEIFSEFDYVLIHQTDALMFKDNLDYWMKSGFDYIGAPWPMGMSLDLSVDKQNFGNVTRLKSFVGNGGFSLRSVERTISIMRENIDFHSYWLAKGFNEDCFFSFLGIMTGGYSIPDQKVASMFSMELEPESYFRINNGTIPTGCHAWWKHDLSFWQKIISVVG